VRTYELMFVVDPRVPDEDVVALTDEVKTLLQGGGGEIAKEQSWGKRKLAYEIGKQSEGKYVLLHVRVADGNRPFPLVEQRLKQNERVLRYLTVRTDTGRMRFPFEPDHETAVEAAVEAE
jgi:small subunit ribosomal protein S6